ncbi:hypothetical protein [Marivita sp. XM-24bin2]|jgi:hypothetical protein|uniref:hypothetical protein n=1 Tax=unclassified Marivita TaxID=2632480 RepID=UPI000D79FB85|nr:hypothetical protein [Marivita sp. XM-24bin2]MCR9108885.1 hypothetical protein [Paracoccaceae bacterium]PWL34941.1 MAG: hypothetical protein DCO97_11905 [Marivita sp. XM-24bin2]
MKVGAIVAGVVLVAAVAFGVYMVDIDQTEEGTLPTVSIDGGNMPEFDAEVGDVEVGERDVTVTVPDVDLESPEEENVASN